MSSIECSNNILLLWISVFLLEWNMFRRFRFPQCFVSENIISIYNVGPPAILQPRTIYEHVTERRQIKTFRYSNFVLFCCNSSCGITKMHFTMAWGEWNKRTAQCECVFMSDGRCIYWHRQTEKNTFYVFMFFFVLFVCCFL